MGLAFTTLSPCSDSFASCAGPLALRELCDRLGPATIGLFLERWYSRLPLPLTAADGANGCWSELSMRQDEGSSSHGRFLSVLPG